MKHLRFLRPLIDYSEFKLSILMTVMAFLCFLSFGLPAYAIKPIDIAFDLDWTLINPTTEEMAAAAPEDIIRINEKLFRFSQHTFEVLAALHAEPNVRISYFSGGSVERNQVVIKAIYERLQQANPEFRPYRILSLPELTQISNDATLKFSKRFKKNLSLYFDLKNAILVDDIADLIMPGQEANKLWLGKTYNDRPRFDLAYLENVDHAAYSAPNEAEWKRDRDKLLPIKEILLKAIAMTHKNSNSFIDNLQAYQNKIGLCRGLF